MEELATEYGQYSCYLRFHLNLSRMPKRILASPLLTEDWTTTPKSSILRREFARSH